MTMKMNRAFGVGCFHFGYQKPTPFEFKASTYIEELRTALGSLQSIGDLSATCEENYDYTATIEEDQLSIKDGGLFPYISFLEVVFSVFIPARVQDDTFPGESISARTTTEKFRVTTRHSFHGPVSFVECVDAEEECDPSSAVRLLRVYMSRQFSKVTSAVTFEALGPSPFHADFFIQAGASDMDEIRMEEVEQRGYNRITFFHAPSADSGEVLESVQYEIGHELDLYYDIQRRSVEMMRKGDELIATWSQLQETAEIMPPLWNVRARLQLHRAARNLVLRALTLQAEFAVEERQIAHEIAETYRKGTPTYMEKYVRDRAERLPTYPIGSVLEWARHVEEGSFKQAEIIAVVLSAIGGGIVGSLATLLSSGGR